MNFRVKIKNSTTMNNNKISITVKNFGPIEGPITLNLNHFIIFSGDSGLGKSYLAMLIHFVYRIVAGDDLLQFLTESKQWMMSSEFY